MKCWTILLSAALFAPSGLAAYEVAVPIEVQADFLHAEAGGDETDASDVYAKIEPDLRIDANDWLAFNLGLTLEPVLDPDDNHRFFDDEGLYVRNLNVELKFDPLTVTVGKFSAPFSFGFDEVPGVYGDTLNEDIEVTERIGVIAALGFTGDNEASYTVSAAIFKADTTAFSRSILTDRGRLRHRDGGVGNTGGLENFSVAFDAENAFGATGLHLGAAVLSQDNDDGVDDQFAYVLDAAYAFDLGDDAVLKALAEYFHSDGATLSGIDEVGDGDQAVITVGGAYERGPCNVALVYGRSETEPEAGFGDHDVTDFVQISAGYAFENGFGIDVGYVYGSSDIGDGPARDTVDVSSFGILLSYEFSFGDSE